MPYQRRLCPSAEDIAKRRAKVYSHCQAQGESAWRHQEPAFHCEGGNFRRQDTFGFPPSNLHPGKTHNTVSKVTGRKASPGTFLMAKLLVYEARMWRWRHSALLALLLGGVAGGYALKSEFGEPRTPPRITARGIAEGQGTRAEVPDPSLARATDNKVGPKEEFLPGFGITWQYESSEFVQDLERVEPVRKEVIPDSLLAPGVGKEIPQLAAEDLIATLLRDNPGVFLGDRHGHHNIPEFLTANMSKFARAGVKVFFLEMVKSNEEGQQALDRLRKTGDVKAFAAYLEKRRWGVEKGWADKIGTMVKKAYAEGIAVVGMDREDTGRTRLQTSNPHWKSVIVDYLSRQAFPKDGKYLVFGGAAHSAAYPFHQGVDSLLGIPAVDFRNLKSATPHVRVGDRQDNDFEIALPESKDQPPGLFERQLGIRSESRRLPSPQEDAGS